MDTIVKGIVLKTKDYKENDKLLTILTLEEGKIVVRAKGVKKATSKMKAFCQVFCFGEFELVRNKPFFILSGVKSIDNFYNVTSDYDKFALSSLIPLVCDKICVENEIYSGVFVSAVKALNLINIDAVDPKLAVTKFLLDTLYYEGFEFNFSCCNSCGNPLKEKTFIDLDSGELVCGSCLKTGNFVEISKGILSSIKMIFETSYDKLQTIKLGNVLLEKTFLAILKNVANRFEINYNLFKI